MRKKSFHTKSLVLFWLFCTLRLCYKDLQVKLLLHKEVKEDMSAIFTHDIVSLLSLIQTFFCITWKINIQGSSAFCYNINQDCEIWQFVNGHVYTLFLLCAGQ